MNIAIPHAYLPDEQRVAVTPAGVQALTSMGHTVYVARGAGADAGFSDTDFGITSDYEGHRADSEIGACNVYRADPGTGEVRLVADGFQGPNGLVFSADERRLYVSDSRANHIRVFEVRENGTLSDGRVFAECEIGNFDNIRFDDGGRLWAAAMAGGVHCYDPDGTLLGRLLVPDIVANIRFGGAKRNRMFIAADTALYSLVMGVTGLPHLPAVG